MDRHTSRSRTSGALAAGLAVLLGPGWATQAQAAPPTITIRTPQDLRFGSFAVPATGFREVSVTGTVTGSGIFALDDTGIGPARFTVEYDRGNNSRRRIDLTIEIVLSNPAVFAQGGMTARLSRYQTDLPGYALVQPGQVIRIEIPNCIERVCSRSFNLGGRLDVDRNYGGGAISIPIPIDATVVDVT